MGLRGLASIGAFIALVAFALADEPSTDKSPPKTARGPRDFGYPAVATINERIAAGWRDHEFAPSEAATDGEWVRRVFLDLVGRVPTVAEVRAYRKDKKRPSTGSGQASTGSGRA